VLHLAKRRHRETILNSLDRCILSLAKARLDTVDGRDGYGDSLLNRDSGVFT